MTTNISANNAFSFSAPVKGGNSWVNRVWEDTNKNGRQDEGEEGIGGATVKLLDEKENVLFETKTNLGEEGVFESGTFALKGIENIDFSSGKYFELQIQVGDPLPFFDDLFFSHDSFSFSDAPFSWDRNVNFTRTQSSTVIKKGTNTGDFTRAEHGDVGFTFLPQAPFPSAPDSVDFLQYTASHGDLIQAFGVNVEASYRHYLDAGQHEGRALDSFDEVGYLASNKDLISVFGNDLNAATTHYIQHGYGEGRSTDSFDSARYLASNGDLIQAFGYDLETASQHYISYGASEGRATTSFDPQVYLANNVDVANAYGINNLSAATQHYIENGYREGRSF